MNSLTFIAKLSMPSKNYITVYKFTKYPSIPIIMF